MYFKYVLASVAEIVTALGVSIVATVWPLSKVHLKHNNSLKQGRPASLSPLNSSVGQAGREQSS